MPHKSYEFTVVYGKRYVVQSLFLVHSALVIYEFYVAHFYHCGISIAQ